MRWTASQLLRPVIFVVAIAAAVLTGNRTDSFWLGLLAFFVALGAGRALRALVRSEAARTLYRALWPAAATGYAFLFDALGLPRWATFFVACIAASMTKSSLGPLIPNQRRWYRRVEWRRVDLDDLLP